VAVAGGLVVSTLLTLVVIPVVYTLLDEALASLRARGGATRPADAATVPTASVSKAGR
jgi:hypothetical protein